jgi:hypothetical protein
MLGPEEYLTLKNHQLDGLTLDMVTYAGQKAEIPEIQTVSPEILQIPKPEWAAAEAKAPYRYGA